MNNENFVVVSFVKGSMKMEEDVAAEQLQPVMDINVTLSAVLGSSSMPISQLLKLGRGAIVELERKIGEPIDIYVNNRCVARGEVVTIGGSRLGITMTEIVRVR